MDSDIVDIAQQDRRYLGRDYPLFAVSPTAYPLPLSTVVPLIWPGILSGAPEMRATVTL